MELLTIVWDFDPVLINIFGFEIRWYSLMWVLALLAAGWVGGYCFKHDGKPSSAADTAFLWIVLGTIIGARLGHCLFYEPEVYLPEPWRIITDIRKGGLASHGAALGIVIGMWISSWKNKVSFLWTADRIAIVAPLAGAIIRLGNLFNSEIIGTPTDLPWGFQFMRLQGAPICHPTQLYEALCYIVLFAILFLIYYYTTISRREGFIFGAAMVGIFLSRFCIEFIKIDQVDWESGMVLNMGQWLSLPFVVAGLALMVWAYFCNKKSLVVKQRTTTAPSANTIKNRRHFKK